MLNNGFTPGKVDSIFQGLITITGSDPLTLAINSCIPIYQSSENYFQNGRDITLHFPGIVGNYTGIKTRIDSTHNNIIYSFDSLVGQGYNRTDAVNYLHPNDYFESENINMIDSTFTFHLQANGVALIEFHMPDLTVLLNEMSMNQNKLIIYPNPTNDIVNIIISDEDLISVQVYDLSGKLIMTEKSSSFSMKDYDDSVYYLKIQTKTMSQVKKLIKR